MEVEMAPARRPLPAARPLPAFPDPSLRDHLQIAAARAVPAIGVEDRSLAARAELGIGDARVSEAALLQYRARHRRQVDVRFCIGAIDERVIELQTRTSTCRR